MTGIDSTIGFWTDHNACVNATSPDSTLFPDINIADNSSVVRYDYSPCDPYGDVRLYKLIGGGHNSPGGPGPIHVPIIGYSNKDINGAYEIWKFFSSTSCQPITTLSELPKEIEIVVYPNPVQNIVTIKSELTIEKIVVWDLLGKIVGIFDTTQIDLIDLSTGTYLLEIEFLEDHKPAKRLIQKL